MTVKAAMTAFEFGSRSGSWFALALFSAMFAPIGWGVAREIRQRSHASSSAVLIGLTLFVAPVAMVYASSLDGFYEAAVDGEMLRLTYLMPQVVAEVPITDVTSVAAVPAFRGRQRLQIAVRSGRRFESATWYPKAIAESAMRLKELLPRSGARRVSRDPRPNRFDGSRMEQP